MLSNFLFLTAKIVVLSLCRDLLDCLKLMLKKKRKRIYIRTYFAKWSCNFKTQLRINNRYTSLRY